MLGLLLVALSTPIASAHGPAPAALGVLAWTPDSPCEALPGPVPALVRTNIGLARHGEEGGYAYGCPARWGDEAQALATSPDGAGVLLAGSGGAWWSADGGCAASSVVLPPDEVPVAVAALDGTAWLLTRTFGAVPDATLWRVVAGLADPVVVLDELLPDGMVAGDDALWLAGARPSPGLLAVEGGVPGDLLALPLDDVDRVIPRAAAGGEVWAVAGVDAASTLVRLWPGPLEAAEGASILGPVRLDVGWTAVVDGAVWSSRDGAWSPTGEEVPWTCLRDDGGVVHACSLEGVRRLDGDRPLVFTLEQLGASDPACDDVDGACTLDWLHFGGESGWSDTLPAACPGEARGPRVPPPLAPLPDDGGCSCGSVSAASAPGLAILGLLLGSLRRRSRASS